MQHLLRQINSIGGTQRLKDSFI